MDVAVVVQVVVAAAAVARVVLRVAGLAPAHNPGAVAAAAVVAVSGAVVGHRCGELFPAGVSGLLSVHRCPGGNSFIFRGPEAPKGAKNVANRRRPAGGEVTIVCDN